MNILFLTGDFPTYGGVETVTIVLSNEFVKRGHVVSIASFKQSMPSLVTPLLKVVKLYNLSKPVLSIKNLFVLRNILKKEKIDIIINQWCLPFYVTFLCLGAKWNLPCKLFSVLHNTPDSNGRMEKIKIKLNDSSCFLSKFVYKIELDAVRMITGLSIRYVYNSSDTYVILSDSFRNIFQRITRLENLSKLITISNPLTLINTEPFVYRPDQKKKEIIYVGRLEYKQKRVDRILEIWRIIEMKYPDWILKIIGDGPELLSLQRMQRVYDLKRVHFEGFGNPIPYYKEASILLLTSEYEGFGLVIVEAMAYGVIPVVYGSYPAVYDIIEEGVDGMIVPPSPGFNMSEMLRKIELLITDAVLREKLSRGAIEKSKRFALSRIVDCWMSYFA